MIPILMSLRMLNELDLKNFIEFSCNMQSYLGIMNNMLKKSIPESALLSEKSSAKLWLSKEDEETFPYMQKNED